MDMLPYLLLGLLAIGALFVGLMLLYTTLRDRNRLLLCVADALAFRVVEDDREIQERLSAFRLTKRRSEPRYERLLMRTLDDTTLLFGDLYFAAAGAHELETAVVVRSPLFQFPECVMVRRQVEDDSPSVAEAADSMAFLKGTSLIERFHVEADHEASATQILGAGMQRWLMEQSRAKHFSLETRNDMVLILTVPALTVIDFEVLFGHVVKLERLLIALAGHAEDGGGCGSQRRLRDVVSAYAQRIVDERVFFAPGLPNRRVRKAWETFVSDQSVEQEVWVLVDDAPMRDGSAGLVITDRGVYARGRSGPAVFRPLSGWAEVSCEGGLQGQQIKIEGEEWVRLRYITEGAARLLAECLGEMGRVKT